ncbi:D-alanyl-D-alanine carboxypeptidase/D-alanyl-D-alanine endopeptidase [Roseibacillus persicicus]|uniref:Peptidase S13 n=1 Tax=Roseibacillus persicicus TaxID=454148 RepID=A0A918WLC6_9BACT|nr:D-alanyl-D-alanine carboxypeptidase/D-alanyl-D-alanine-endopeptidase [Roseibacillus persicicus]GHC56801.1 peptidase S13 [Roseibacillus persicicus]
MNRLLGFIASFALNGIGAAEPLDDFLKSPALKTASVGFAMVPLDPPEEGEDPLSEVLHNPDQALTPASVQKAITTATALQILGPDYRFVTKLYRSGDDVIIMGGGDPLLASTSLDAEFPAWHQALLDAGMTSIEGSLIADPSFFEDCTTPNQWLWGDIGNYYGAGACGLCFHRNSFEITFQPGEVGQEAKMLSAYPRPPRVTFRNHMKTGTSGSGDQGYAYSGPERDLITLRGTVPAGGQFSIKGSLPNPALSCLSAFRSYLKKKDFPVNDIEVKRGTAPKEEDLLLAVESPSLAKIIVPTNMKSVNLNAECLFKALTPEGKTTSSQKALHTHWKEQGVDLTGFLAHDGSGLSPQNTLTARQVAAILKLTNESEHAATFRASLPIAGRTGTMRGFGRGTAAEGRVMAKSGSMERVRAWAGYLKTESNKRFAFALLINHYNGSDSAVRSAASRFLAKLCEE